MKRFLTLLLLCAVNKHFSQQLSNIVFQPMVGKNILEPGKMYSSERNRNFSVTALKFFVSDFRVVLVNGTEIKSNDCWLIDLDEKASLQRIMSISGNPAIRSVYFKVGVLVEANTAGALSGDLDPSSGMYWSWQSGYINFKIEGTSPVCKTHDNEFSFHLDGYKPNEQTARQIDLHYLYPNTSGKIVLNIDVSKLLENIDLSNKSTVNIPGAEAMQMADLITKKFMLSE